MSAVSCVQVSLAISVGTYVAVLGLQVPLFALIGFNVGWCFGYATGCAEVAVKLEHGALRVLRFAAQPLLECLHAVLKFGLRRLLPGYPRARLL